ncbi:hypothetical protein ASV53_23920 [Photobacterium sanguinicancri]|uniref:DUF3987 domain-containing protein n=2 Tax=Photobacterium sanguinicancri TaxID=875932 RepID=A0ABX4FR64_9GAMM|nr:hypothetical protein ASV53_23920 [Photobacterium sanguinicancri]
MEVQNMDKNVLFDSNNQKSKTSQEIEWGDVKELNGNGVVAMPLQKDMLPFCFQEYVYGEAKKINNANPDYLAMSLVVTVASLIGGTSSIRPKKFDKGWSIRPAVWGIGIGKPSDYKTPLMEKPIDLVSYVQKSRIDIFNFKNVERQKIENEIITKREKGLEEKAKIAFEKGDEEKGLELIDELSMLTKKSYAERNILLTDATPEAVILRLATNPFGILIYRDEISGLFYGMNKQGREQERSLFLEGFNASKTPYTQERIGRDNVKLESVHISILGGIQPKVLEPILHARDNGKADDGFFERFQLAVFPESNNCIYTDIEGDNSDVEKVKSVFLKLAELGEYEPKDYDFSDEAQKIWNDWACEFTTNLNELACDVQSIRGKYPALVAKLALVFHLSEEAARCKSEQFTPSQKVTEYSLQLALKWLEYLITHSNKIVAFARGVNDVSVKSLINNLHKFKGSFTKQELSQKDWKGLLKSEDRNRALQILEKNGYIKQVSKPRKMYLVHPDYC